MKNVAVLTEDRAFALLFRPHPWGFDSSRIPTPENLLSKQKKKCSPRPGEGGGGLGAAGIDWCITKERIFLIPLSIIFLNPKILGFLFFYEK